MIAIAPEQVARWRPSTPALRRLFRRVKRLPWPGARAWLSFPRQPPAPDFLILDAANRAFLLTAGVLSARQAEALLQPGLFAEDAAAGACLSALQASACGLAEFARDVTGTADITRCLICPGLDDAAAAEWANRLGLAQGIVVAGEPESLAAFLCGRAGAPLEAGAADALRAAFSIESQIPPAFVPRITTRLAYSGRIADPENTRYLLDFPQESWVKHELLPDEAARKVIHGTPARLITGVAGSGKSLVLLYRARLLCRLAAERAMPLRCLFVTHNKPLIGELQSRFSRLQGIVPIPPGSSSLVEFCHFFRWCGKLHYDDRLSLIHEQERNRRIAEIAREAFPDSGFPSRFFVEEIGFIADQVEDSEPAYLAADRTGRGIALDQVQRHRMHAVYRRYRGSLAANRETDWQFMIRIVWEKVAAGQLRLPRYDAIFVDEAQFFAPLWFAILNACLLPGTGEFVVAADPTQGFLKRRLSWRSVGLSVAGRSARLTRSYRNTAAIQAFARRFYESRILARTDSHLAEETLLPDPPTGDAAQRVGGGGGSPRFVKHRADQDAALWAANEVAAALRGGLPPSAILVLVQERRALDALLRTLSERIRPHPARILSHEAVADDNAVALSTFNSATGVERPVVILLGIDALFDQEGDPRLDERQRQELVRDNTRKIYMALTRAGEKLIISHRHDRTRQLLEAM